MLGARSLSGHGSARPVKLICEVLFAALLLVLVAPIMALIALCVFLESPGPILYRARRIGCGGKQLDVLKFRKMHHCVSGRPLTVGDDERFTSIGRWLARTKLDELPQLINVLRGEMSLIGPRPEDPDFVLRHAEQFKPILRVRPGMTGLSQLVFVDESRILDPDDPIRDYEERILPQKLQLDGLYLARWSLGLDVQILWWTLATVVLRVPVAVNRTTARITVQRGRRPEQPVLQLQGQSPATDGDSILDLQCLSVTEGVHPAVASAGHNSADPT